MMYTHSSHNSDPNDPFRKECLGGYSLTRFKRSMPHSSQREFVLILWWNNRTSHAAAANILLDTSED